MKKIVLLEKKGNVLEKKIDKISISNFKKILKPKSNQKIENIHNWTDNDTIISLYGFINGNAGNENKHELPPPIDCELFYGDIIICMKQQNTLKNFTVEDFMDFYEKKCGGFVNIETESDNSILSDKSDTDSDYIPSSTHDSDEDDQDFENNIHNDSD